MQYLKQEVRNRIMDAAKTEFSNNGFFDASIRNIAEMSDVSLGNIYRYFTDKEALFIAVCSEMLQSAVNLANSELSFSTDALNTLCAGIEQLLAQYDSEIAILIKASEQYKIYFFSTVTEVLSRRLQAYIAAIKPELVQVLTDSFFNTVCNSFIQSLSSVVKNGDVQPQQIREIVWFFFGDLHSRFNGLTD